MSLWRKLRARTVFNRIDSRTMHTNEILGVYFHRAAALSYFIYAVWGVVSFVGYIPTLAHEVSPGFQDFFSLLVAPIAAAAAVGATFFPRTARVEMFAASGLLMLVSVYLIIMFLSGFSGDISRLTNAVLNTTHIVWIFARVAFIVYTLLRAARLRQQTNTEEI